MKSRKKLHEFADRIAFERLLNVMKAQKSVRTPTLADPGRQRYLEELRAEELDRDLALARKGRPHVR